MRRGERREQRQTELGQVARHRRQTHHRGAVLALDDLRQMRVQHRSGEPIGTERSQAARATSHSHGASATPSDADRRDHHGRPEQRRCAKPIDEATRRPRSDGGQHAVDAQHEADDRCGIGRDAAR